MLNEEVNLSVIMNRLFGMPATKAAKTGDIDTESTFSSISTTYIPSHHPSSPTPTHQSTPTPENIKKNVTISISTFMFIILVAIFMGNTLMQYEKYSNDNIEKSMLKMLPRNSGKPASSSTLGNPATWKRISLTKKRLAKKPRNASSKAMKIRYPGTYWSP